PGSTDLFASSMFWAALHLSLAVLGAVCATAILAAAISDVIEDLRRERDMDPLTGVLNRRGFEAAASAVLAGRNIEALSVIVCDLDHFKHINDRHGHQAGDEVLARFGALLRHCVVPPNMVGRMGGEEFVVLTYSAGGDG